MTYNFSVNTRGDMKLSLFGDSRLDVRTYTTHPGGIEFHSIDDNNIRTLVSYPEDGDLGAAIIIADLNNIRKSEAPKDALLAEAVKKILQKTEEMFKEV